MTGDKKNGKKRGSLFLSLLNRFTAFIYSLFTGGWMIGSFARGDSYESSLCGRILDSKSRSAKRGRLSAFTEKIVEKSKSLRALRAFRAFFACLSLNVYGVFFFVYAVTSIFIYYIKILILGNGSSEFSTVIIAAVMALCALPMMLSSRPTVTYVSESKMLRRICISFLGVPEEKFKNVKRYGGASYVMLSALLAMLLGAATYFINLLHVPFFIGAAVIILLISANPETGVVLTVTAVPFLQYFDYAELILVGLVVTTGISYISKLIKHKRIITFSSESVMALIFGGFVLVTGIFSAGGADGFVDALLSAVVILGGFFTVYNLMRGERLRSVCVTAIAVSFSILAIIGVWNVLYDAVVDGVIYSLKEYVQPIFEGNNIYIEDGVEVFGVFAVIAFPLVFCNLAKQKKVKDVVVWLMFLSVLMAATFIYGTYETVIALIIEFCLFWVLYSHKTLNAVIFSLLPIGFLVILFPYIANYFDLHSVSEEIGNILPLGFPNATSHFGAAQSTLNMLNDGNLLGIGAGQHAFDSAMAGYGNIASYGFTDAGVFWLQVICWSGVGGAVTFLVFSGLLFKNSLGALAITKDKSIRTETLALTCSLFVALVFGSVNCLWNDMRMLYLFWVIAGLLAAHAREGRDSENKISAEQGIY